MRILVTGGAGFIGNTLALRLCAEGHTVVIVDCVTDYYDPTLKEARLARLPKDVVVRRVDITDAVALAQVFAEDGPFDRVAHLAAQAGVRYSIEDPLLYAETNYIGSLNVFEAAKRHGVVPVVYASTSSVYGNSTAVPFREDSSPDAPVSVYAATKRAVELLAYTYTDLFDMHLTGLRFFTVYGPWGRPDMAIFSFTKAILEGTPIELYNAGDMRRDFTYVDDIVDGFVRALQAPQGYTLYNLGNGAPVYLKRFVEVIEACTGKRAQVIEKPMQPGDVYETYADIAKARAELGYAPTVGIEEGVRRFVAWYREYYGVGSA